jgi:copper transport protein
MVRRHVACAAALAVAALGLAPAVAAAHATLEGTSPARGAKFGRAPAEVRFRFDESVEASFGALRVFDSHGRQVQTGAAFHPGGRGSVVAVRLKPGLPHDAYTATYRVISADGHPVSSGFVFTVGHAAGPAESVDRLLAGSGTGPVTSTALAVARAIQYGAIVVGLGTVIFLVVCWAPALTGGRRPRAAGPFRRRIDRLLAVTVIAGVLSAAAAVVLEGATGLGGAFSSALHWAVIRETLGTRFGTTWGLGCLAWAIAGAFLVLRPPPGSEEDASRGARTGAGSPEPASAGGGEPGSPPALTAAAAVAVLAPPEPPAPAVTAAARDPWLLALAVPLGALALLPAFGGHGTEQPPVLVMAPANIVHLLAVSAWLGGIAVLVLALRTATASLPAADRTPLLAAVVGRFSALATVALPVLLLSGVAQAIVEVRTFPHLIDTAFGRAVLIKVCLAIGIVALGYANRSRNLPALRKAAGGASPGRAGVNLRRALRGELALGLGAIAATGALSGYAPSVAASTGPFAKDVIAGPIRAEVTIDPATPGANEAHLYLFDRRTGAAFTRTKQLTVTAAMPHHGIAPIPLTPHVAGPGHYVIDDATFGAAGDWTVTLTDRVSAFDQYETHLTVPIR